MNYGFDLYIDEAGDEGIDDIRVADGVGSSEYFVLSGVLIRTHRHSELAKFVLKLKSSLGLEDRDEIHFRDLDAIQQRKAISDIGRFKAGLICIVSNKRNMHRYRNRRVEKKNLKYQIVEKYVHRNTTIFTTIYLDT